MRFLMATILAVVLLGGWAYSTFPKHIEAGESLPAYTCNQWGCEIATPTPRSIRTATATPTPTRSITPTVSPTTTVRVVVRIADTATATPVSVPPSALGGGPPPATAPPSPWTPMATATSTPTFMRSITSTPIATVPSWSGPPGIWWAVCPINEHQLYLSGWNLSPSVYTLYLQGSPDEFYRWLIPLASSDGSGRYPVLRWTNNEIVLSIRCATLIGQANWLRFQVGQDPNSVGFDDIRLNFAGTLPTVTPTQTPTSAATITPTATATSTPTIARSPTPLPEDLTADIVDSWRVIRRGLAEIYYTSPTSKRKMGFHTTNGLCDDFQVPPGIQHQVLRGSETYAMGGPGPTTDVCAAVFWRELTQNPTNRALELCITGCDLDRFHPNNSSQVTYRTSFCDGAFVLPTTYSDVSVVVLDPHITGNIATRVCYAVITLRE